MLHIGMTKILNAVAIVTYGISWAASEKCKNVGPPVKFKLISSQNLTGHWVAQVRDSTGNVLIWCKFQVELERGEVLDSTYQTGEQLSVEIDQYTTICEGCATVKIVATITAPPTLLASGYELVPGIGYYKFHSKSAVWEEARKICIKEGAHLAIINSETESAVLKKLLLRYPRLEDVQHQATAFLGFHDMGIEGQFFTIFGEPLNTTGFYRWSPGQPDNAGNSEDCGSILTNGALNDLPCHGKHAFICERQLS